MITALIIISICFVLSFIILKDIFAPSVIVSALWLFCIILFNVYPHNLIGLNGMFYTSISIWVGVFTISALLVNSFSHKTNNTKINNQSIRSIYFYISLITFPIAIWNIFKFFTELGITTNIFYNLRLAALGGFKELEEGTSKNYFAVFWLVTYILELYLYEKKYKWRVISLFIINFSWALIVVSKWNFLYLFSATLFVLYIKKIVKIRHLLIFGGVIFLFFSYLQIQRTLEVYRSKDGKLDYDMITLYMLSDMPAFEKIKPESSKYYGEKSFRFFYAVGYRTGLSDTKPSNPILPFIDVSGIKNVTMYTNTYTTLYPFYKDFGNKGVIVFAILSGLFCGYVYEKVRRKNIPMIIIYSLVVASLITQFMNESMFTGLSLFLQVIILSHLPFWTKIRCQKKQNKVEQHEVNQQITNS